MPTDIPESELHPEKFKVIKAKPPLREDGEYFVELPPEDERDEQSKSPSEDDVEEEEEVEQKQALVAATAEVNPDQPLENTFLTVEAFDDYRDHINHQLHNIASKIDNLLARFG